MLPGQFRQEPSTLSTGSVAGRDIVIATESRCMDHEPSLPLRLDTHQQRVARIVNTGGLAERSQRALSAPVRRARALDSVVHVPVDHQVQIPRPDHAATAEHEARDSPGLAPRAISTAITAGVAA